MRRILKITGWFALFLLLIGSGMARTEFSDSPWENYKQAAQLFRQNEDSEQIVELCKSVQKETRDMILFARAGFLLSDVYGREMRFEDAHKVLAHIYKNKKDMPAALCSEAQLRDANLYLKENRAGAALALFKKVASDSASNVSTEACLALAWNAANANDWRGCDSLLSDIKKTNPQYENDERLVALSAKKALGLGNADEAIQLLKDGHDKNSLQYLARAYEQSGNQMMAVSIYKKIYDRFPNSEQAEDALCQAAEVFMRAEDWLAAESEYKRILQYFPQGKNTAAIHFRLGWIYLNVNQVDAALQEFRFGSNQEQEKYFKYMEAECLRRLGASDPAKLQQAISLFHTIASMHMRSSIAPLAKAKAAMAEMEKGDTSGAVISMKQFLSLYPKDDLVPSVNLLISLSDANGTSQKYLSNIVSGKKKGEVFDAALFSLHNRDYSGGDYQSVINRNAIYNSGDTSNFSNYWQRANHLMVAESAYYLKHYELALQQYEAAASDQKDDLAEKAHLGEAWCRLQTDKMDEAIGLFAEIQYNANGVNQVLASYGYATALFLSRQYKEALQAYPADFDAEVYPEYAALAAKSMFRSAECYYRLQYYAQAIETWEALVQRYPTSEFAAEAEYKVGDTYFQANSFADADSAFQFILNNYPLSKFAADSKLRLAQSAYNAGNFQGAIDNYQAFLEDYPKHDRAKDALDGIQLCYYQIGQTDQASEALAKLVEQSPNSDLAADARFRIASNLLQQGKYDEAISTFKEILTLYPNSSYAMDSQFALAKCFIAQENYNSANQELKRFIQYFPGSSNIAEAYYLLGLGYFNSQSYLSALENFKKIVDAYRDSEFFGQSLQNIGLCYDRLNDKNQALDYFVDYLKTNPADKENPKVNLNVARLMAETDKIDGAVLIFEKLMKAGDKEVAIESAYHLGVIYTSKSKMTEAKNAFKFAIENAEQDNYFRLSSLAQIGAIYENYGASDKAIATYKILAKSTGEEQWVNAARERIRALSSQGGAYVKKANYK